MITTTDPKQIQKSTAEPTAEPAKESKRSLADLAKQIRQDASQDTLAYLLRSNTSHDGE